MPIGTLHYPGSMKLWLALLGMAWIAGAQSGARPPVTLAVHILVPCGAGAGKPVAVAEVAARLCLDRSPFLTQDDVQAAEIQVSSKGHPMVFLTFHEPAAIRELQITRKNIGNHVAILVNGRVVSAPAVSAASRLLYIDGDFTRSQADALVMAFNHYAAGRGKSGGK